MQVLTAILRWVFAVAAAGGLTLGLFLVLPFMQSITARDQAVLVATDAPTILEEPPPDVEEEEPPPDEPEDELEPPEIIDEPLQLPDVSLLDLPLGTGTGVPVPGADTTINLDSALGGGDDLGSMFDLDELDKKATVLSQVSPKMTDELRRRAPATVIVVFEVDARGRVQKASVASSSDKAFESAALSAVKQWTFEPAQRRGKPVADRLRVPITFPKE